MVVLGAVQARALVLVLMLVLLLLQMLVRLLVLVLAVVLVLAIAPALALAIALAIALALALARRAPVRSLAHIYATIARCTTTASLALTSVGLAASNDGESNAPSLLKSNPWAHRAFILQPTPDPTCPAVPRAAQAE